MQRRYVVQDQPGYEAHAYQTINPALQCAAIRAYEKNEPFYICETTPSGEQVFHRIVDVRRLRATDQAPAKCKVLPP